MTRDILTLIDYDVAGGRNLYGACACCGGDLKNGGVEFKKLFSSSTFNMNHEFYDASLKHVCKYCEVFFSKDKWVEYCEATGNDPYFPRVEGKKPFLANWVFFSHAFYTGRHEIVKDRKRWRELLTSPPTTPFCFVISTICKKHLIFKTPVQHSRDSFILRFEDDLVLINRDAFTELLNVFEEMYSQGLSKASIVTGNYNSSALLKSSNEVVSLCEPALVVARKEQPAWLKICEFIGAKNEDE